MKKLGNTILIISILMFIASGILVFIPSVNRNIAGLLIVLGLIFIGAGSSLKKKK